MVSPIDSSAPFTPSEAASATAAALLVDTVCVRTIDILRDGGVQTVLLKGPSVARWLYPDTGRPYVDVDLLIRHSAARAAGSVLGDAGYVSLSPERSDVEIGGRFDWLDRRSGIGVDLHTSLNLLEHLQEAMLWDVVGANLEEIEVLGRPVPVLAETLRALHVMLHALGHEQNLSPQARRDRQRLLDLLSLDQWREVADMAARLDAVTELAEALRLETNGAGIAQALGLPTHSSTRSIVRRAKGGSVRDHALSFNWWWALPLREKLTFVRVKLLPSPDYLRARSHLARRGPLGLILAYPARVAVVLIRALRAAGLWFRAKRKAQR